MSHHAIPTKYGGVQFRSRLEAKWAAFFDLVRWHWEYEPVDFNGWIPDFALIGKTQVTYVEVKPAFAFPADDVKKVVGSGCSDEVLVVGAVNPVSAWRSSDSGSAHGPGWFMATESLDYDGSVYHVPAEYMMLGSGGWGFTHPNLNWDDRISGLHGHSDFDRFVQYADDAIQHDINQMWRDAGNAVQWKPRESRPSSKLTWQRES